VPTSNNNYIRQRILTFMEGRGRWQIILQIAAAGGITSWRASVVPLVHRAYWFNVGAWFLGSWGALALATSMIKKARTRGRAWASSPEITMVPGGGYEAKVTIHYSGCLADVSAKGRIIRTLHGANPHPDFFVCYLWTSTGGEELSLSLNDGDWAQIVIAQISSDNLALESWFAIRCGQSFVQVPDSCAIVEITATAKPSGYSTTKCFSITREDRFISISELPDVPRRSAA
jgi:hypothetical protein